MSSTGYSMGVCNSKAYGGGMYVAPQAELDDGKLDIVAKEAVPKPRSSSPSPSTSRARTSRIRAFTRGSAPTSRSTPSRTFEIYADGDPIGATPARITVRPRCLRVIAPPA